MKELVREKKTRASEHCEPKTRKSGKKPWSVEFTSGAGSFIKYNGWHVYRRYATQKDRDNGLAALLKSHSSLRGYLEFRAGTP